MRTILIVLMLTLLTSCVGAVSDNLEDGYQPGDVSEGLKADKAWYCGNGMLGIRAVARFVLRGIGVPVIDVCKAIDVIVDEDAIAFDQPGQGIGSSKITPFSTDARRSEFAKNFAHKSSRRFLRLQWQTRTS